LGQTRECPWAGSCPPCNAELLLVLIRQFVPIANFSPYAPTKKTKKIDVCIPDPNQANPANHTVWRDPNLEERRTKLAFCTLDQWCMSTQWIYAGQGWLWHYDRLFVYDWDTIIWCCFTFLIVFLILNHVGGEISFGVLWLQIPEIPGSGKGWSALCSLGTSQSSHMHILLCMQFFCSAAADAPSLLLFLATDLLCMPFSHCSSCCACFLRSCSA